MRARPELVVAYRQADENLEATNKLYPLLHLSKLTHQWCHSASVAFSLPHRTHRDDASISSKCISINLEYWYTSIELFQGDYIIFILGVEELLLDFEG